MCVVFIVVCRRRGGKTGGCGATSCIVGRRVAEEGSGVTGTDQFCRFGEDLLLLPTRRTGSSEESGVSKEADRLGGGRLLTICLVQSSCFPTCIEEWVYILNLKGIARVL